MAEIIPFRGYRYNPEKNSDLSRVLAPPYDIMPPEVQKQYFDRDENNVIRVDYRPELPGEDSKYEGAAKTLDGWIREQILVQDEAPAIYVTEQEFLNLDGVRKVRRGFNALLRVEEFGKGIVFPHEKTFPKHKQDRLMLVKTAHVEANPVFMFFPDAGLAVLQLLEKATAGAPDVTFDFDDGSTNRMWMLREPGMVARLQKLMAERPIYIADGHHRYDTALNFRNETEARLGSLPADHPARFALVYFTPMQDPGIELISPQRDLKNIPDFEIGKALAVLGEHFNVDNSDKDSVLAAIRDMSKPHVFGLQAGNVYYRLTLKEGAMAAMPSDLSQVCKELDTNICTHLIVMRLVGDPEKLLERIEYETDTLKACEKAASGAAQATVYVQPSTMAQIIDVVSKKEVMPQKSTYFYPKLITGLVIYRLDMA